MKRKYICVSNEINIDYDTFIADSVENAKKQVEGMLLDHWKEQIVYLEDCIDEITFAANKRTPRLYSLI